MTDRPDYVAQYAQAGYALFPISGKTPTIKEWQKTPPNPALTINDLPGNFGVVLPDSILVVDVDVKNKAPGRESFVKLGKDLGLPTKWQAGTYLVKTGSGGLHIYLQKPPDLRIVKKHPDYPGIDFLSKGNFVVGAGSVHPDTKVEYTPVADSTPGGVQPAPAKLLEIITKSEVKTEGNVKEDVFDDDPFNVQAFVEVLKEMPGAPQGSRTNSVYIAACRGRDLSLSTEKTAECLLCHYNEKLSPPLPAEEIERTVRSAYKYAKDKAGNKNPTALFDTVSAVRDDSDLGNITIQSNAKKAIKANLNNAVSYLRNTPGLVNLFRYNTFTENIELSSAAPWYNQRGLRSANITDEDVILLKFAISRIAGVEFSQEILMEAIVIMGMRQHYHPVRNYLNSLKWDGVPRLDNWLVKYAYAADNAYTRAVGRKTLCAAVRRVYEPGCKWDYVLILEGPQGIGKSTLCRILGRSWSGDMNLDPHQKDSVQMMLGKWIIELSEMVALKWAEASALKSFITRELDTVRLAYARHVKDFPRQSIFIGTVNPEHIGYLSDNTGNRRFWIVQLPKKINLIGLEQECDQLWAEAVQRYRSETPYLTGEAEILHGYEAQARMPEDPMRRQVVEYVTKAQPEKDEVEIIDLLEFCGIAPKSASKIDQSRLAQSLIELKWTKNIKIIDGIVRTVYLRPKDEQLKRMVDEL